jgi:hypothetical protein
MSNNAFAIVKLSTQLVAGLGVTKIVSDIIQNNTNVETTAQAVKVWVGGAALAGVMVKQSSDYIEDQATQLRDWLASRKAETAEEAAK